MSKNEVFKNLTVCIIENNPIDKHLIIMTLKMIGICNIIHYMSFPEALEDFENLYCPNLPDFIIGDCDTEDFRELDWFECYTCNRLCEIPLLLLTSTVDNSMENYLPKFNVAQLIKKPIVLITLKNYIMTFFSRKFHVIKK